jgi:NADPH-dependent F420 reductase
VDAFGQDGAMASAEPHPDLSSLVVGVLGGSGPQGRGLALRFATAGLRVVVGSRSAERGKAVAAELAAPGRRIDGGDNAAAARAADVVVVAVPWEGHAGLLAGLRAELTGKVVVDCVNPLGFDERGPYALGVPEGSAAQQAAALLPDSTVVAAFHHVSAVLLTDERVVEIDTDVLVLGDVRSATDLVEALAGTIPGVRGVYGGRLRNAGQVEGLAANLVAVNRRYRAHAGLRVTDVRLADARRPRPGSRAPA